MLTNTHTRILTNYQTGYLNPHTHAMHGLGLIIVFSHEITPGYLMLHFKVLAWN